MSHKKETGIAVSPEENAHIQQLLDQRHQIAQHLHTTTNQMQAEEALTAINALSETAQIALLRALAKENDTDSADILAAVNTISQHKEVRKEARRSLIRLEETKTRPQWTLPITQAPAVQANTDHAPRFWKGVVTQAREEGELQLMLCWEQGYDYTEVRSMTFLLDFWRDGMKDCVVEMSIKRTIDTRIDDMRTQLVNIPIVDCTLAEGKRLIEEALSINEWRGITPHQEYRNHISIIKRLILQTEDVGEDHGRTFINPELEDQEVVINFLGGWIMGDYGLAYDLLTDGNSIREGLSRAEWVERRRAWANEAKPARMMLAFVHERERSQSALWIPTPVVSGQSTVRKDIEVGWSLELSETPLSGTLKEMPMGTSVNKETGRHWCWTSYTLEREHDLWHIQHITDEGANVQSLSVTELQQRIKEYEEIIDDRLKRREQITTALMQELPWRLTQLLHYYDALISQLPLDRSVCEDAYGHAVVAGNPERIQVYLERIIERFPDKRGETLRRLGVTLAGVADTYGERGMQDRKKHFLARAEATVRDAISAEDIAMNHILLSELLVSQNCNDQAEAELQHARTMVHNIAEEASIEVGLGNIAMQQDRIDEAIPYYARVAEIKSDYPGIWFNLGFAYRMLGDTDRAESSYQRAVRVEPHDIRAYSELTVIYLSLPDQQQKARTITERGVQANPHSAHFHALFASVLFQLGDVRRAQQELQQAEAINPSLEIVQRVRQFIDDPKKL